VFWTFPCYFYTLALLIVCSFTGETARAITDMMYVTLRLHTCFAHSVFLYRSLARTHFHCFPSSCRARMASPAPGVAAHIATAATPQQRVSLSVRDAKFDTPLTPATAAVWFRRVLVPCETLMCEVALTDDAAPDHEKRQAKFVLSVHLPDDESYLLDLHPIAKGLWPTACGTSCKPTMPAHRSSAKRCRYDPHLTRTDISVPVKWVSVSCDIDRYSRYEVDTGDT
jgi:hypothetical protein